MSIPCSFGPRVEFGLRALMGERDLRCSRWAWSRPVSGSGRERAQDSGSCSGQFNENIGILQICQNLESFIF